MRPSGDSVHEGDLLMTDDSGVVITQTNSANTRPARRPVYANQPTNLDPPFNWKSISAAEERFFSDRRRGNIDWQHEPNCPNKEARTYTYVYRYPKDRRDDQEKSYLIVDEHAIRDQPDGEGADGPRTFTIDYKGDWDVSFSRDGNRMTLTSKSHYGTWDADDIDKPATNDITYNGQRLRQLVIERSGWNGHLWKKGSYIRPKYEMELTDVDKVAHGTLFLLRQDMDGERPQEASGTLANTLRLDAVIR